MPTLTAFLITKNEEADIERCLAALKGWVNEIIVVDDFSADGTRLLAEKQGARVISHAFTGFGPQKQFALEQAQSEWVLSLDADEVVTPQLAREIGETLKNPTVSGYRLRREFYFLGHHLRFGGVGTDFVLRLFRRDKARFTDVAVHEQVLLDGSQKDLNAPLAHYSYPTLKEYLDKCDQYTSLAAQERYAAGKRSKWSDFLRPGWELFQRIVLKGAWLDGRPGLIYAALSSHAAWLRSIKLWEIELQKRS